MPFLFHLKLSRVPPAPLSVEQVVVQRQIIAKEMSIERVKSFFISGVNCNVFRNPAQENGRPTASQMRLNAGSESGIAWGGWGFLREFFRTSTKAKSKGVRPSRADSAIEKAAREKPFRIPPKPIVEPALLRLRRASNLSLVLPPPRSPSCACAVERSSRQARGDRMVVNVLRLLRFIISLNFPSIVLTSLSLFS